MVNLLTEGSRFPFVSVTKITLALLTKCLSRYPPTNTAIHWLYGRFVDEQWSLLGQFSNLIRLLQFLNQLRHLKIIIAK